MQIKVPIEIIEIEPGNFHLFVTLKVGRRKANLLLDTGASKTVFDAEKVLKYSKAEALSIYEAKSVGLGAGAVETKITRMPVMRIAELRIDKAEVAILDLSHVNVVYKLLKLPEIDGVLGSDLLVKHKAVIDYAKGMLTLRS